MEDRCEWKDRKYRPCKNAYNNYLDLGKPYGPFWNQEKQIFKEVSFCPWCGSDIRKPKESDWKILDVNDLSDCPDILVGDYQFQVKDECLSFYPDWGFNSAVDIFQLLSNLKKGFQVRYRPTPTKKTHEELAEEYAQNIPIEGRVWDYNDITEAFIAGRKSMESEK